MLTEPLNAVLGALNGTSSHITRSSVLSKDGFMLACVPPASRDEGLVGAISASLCAAGRRLAEKTLQDRPEQMVVKCAKGCILMAPAGDGAVIIVLMAG